MLGVVVWSNEPRSKAVIWCEDQGALAYLEGTANLAEAAAWPNAGDLVELDCTLEGGLRMARNVRLLSQGAGAALPRALRARADISPTEAAPAAGDLSRLRLVGGRGGPECKAAATEAARIAAAAGN